MRTAAKLFAVSSAFGIAIAIVYWFVSYEWAGTALLVGIGLAPGFVAAYLLAAERALEVGGDDPDQQPADAAGEQVGVFVARSGWPLVLAAGASTAALGLVFGWWLLTPGLALALIAVLGLMRESAG